MTDDTRVTSRTPDGLCPWCSTGVSGDPERCPACGASLREQAEAIRAVEPLIPGLTEVDPALVRKVAPPAQKSRGFMAWLTGDTVADSDAVVDPASLAPPADAVRLEMLRLKVEAVRTNLEAEAALAAAPTGDAPLEPAAAVAPAPAEPMVPEPPIAAPPAATDPAPSPGDGAA
jgi:hypothetical protein